MDPAPEQVIRSDVEPTRPDQVATDHGHHDADDGRETKRVECKGEPEVEAALEDRQP
jgi:hypothetical protein